MQATSSGAAAGATALDIRPLSPTTGAECRGVSVAALGERDWERILAAYHRHSLLVMRDQVALPKGDQIAFSERFGALELPIRKDYLGKDYPALHVVTNVGPDGKPKSTATLENPGNFFWHTDASYMQRPASTTLLYAIEVPAQGGDTAFANMHAAYDALTPEMKARIDLLRVVHSWEQSRFNSGSRVASEEEKQAAPPVAHPLVRTHPETGRKALYMGNHTSHVEGMDIEEGRALLAGLLRHATSSEFVYRHRWLPGDLVVWDNRSLLHKASDDFDMTKFARVLHRTVVQGSIPC